MTDNSSPALRAFDPMSPRSAVSQSLPPDLERIVHARWKLWEPWVRMHVLRRRDRDPDAASRDLRKRHTDHLVALWRAGVTMRTICRHRLDDPRLTDEARALMVRAAMERRRRAGVVTRDDLAIQIKLSNFGPASLASCVAVSATDGQESQESLQAQHQAPRDFTAPEALQRTIESIRKRICEEFYLAELRDADLTKLRSHRQVFAFPRQLAMYLARQLTGASLAEIALQFGGRHHTTVLHSIDKIERLRQGPDVDTAICRLTEQLRQYFGNHHP
jgi:Bacterial dnaA protein helix-turn-helix